MLRFKNVKDERTQMIEDIQTAKERWIENKKIFGEITEPELVDYAIYELKASRIKYMYLLNKLRKK